MIINSDGIEIENEDESVFYIENEYSEQFEICNVGLFYELDGKLGGLYDVFEDRIYQGKPLAAEILSNFPIWLFQGGNNSDLPISKEAFDRLIKKNQNKEYYKYMYMVDCQSLISAVQDRIQFVKYSVVEFYKSLYLNVKPHKDNDRSGVYIVSGSCVAPVYSNLFSVFVNMYSSFDLLTKVVYELQNLKHDFCQYQKLNSNSILYGDLKRLNSIKIEGTIFEDVEMIKKIEMIRHEIIHNGSWEYNHKVFCEVNNGKVGKKWILFPDFSDGRIDSVKNRKRFYSHEIRINQFLPGIIYEYMARINNTIEAINIA